MSKRLLTTLGIAAAAISTSAMMSTAHADETSQTEQATTENSAAQNQSKTLNVATQNKQNTNESDPQAQAGSLQIYGFDESGPRTVHTNADGSVADYTGLSKPIKYTWNPQTKKYDTINLDQLASSNDVIQSLERQGMISLEQDQTIQDYLKTHKIELHFYDNHGAEIHSVDPNKLDHGHGNSEIYMTADVINIVDGNSDSSFNVPSTVHEIQDKFNQSTPKTTNNKNSIDQTYHFSNSDFSKEQVDNGSKDYWTTISNAGMSTLTPDQVFKQLINSDSGMGQFVSGPYIYGPNWSINDSKADLEKLMNLGKIRLVIQNTQKFATAGAISTQSEDTFWLDPKILNDPIALAIMINGNRDLITTDQYTKAIKLLMEMMTASDKNWTITLTDVEKLSNNQFKYSYQLTNDDGSITRAGQFIDSPSPSDTDSTVNTVVYNILTGNHDDYSSVLMSQAKGSQPLDELISDYFNQAKDQSLHTNAPVQLVIIHKQGTNEVAGIAVAISSVSGRNDQYTQDSSIRLLYQPMQNAANYTGSLQPIYWYTAGGSGGTSSGFMYLPIENTPSIQHAQINYIDDVTGKTIDHVSASGNLDSKIDVSYDQTLQKLLDQGYSLVSTDFDNPVYQLDDAKNQFAVHLNHQQKKVQRTKTVSQIINYEYNDGTKAADPVIRNVSFVQTGVQDMVTKQVTWDQTDQQKTFDQVTSPNINDYTPDKLQVNAVSVNPQSDDLFETVIYHKSAPTEPEQPAEPEQPVTPDQPSTPTNPSKSAEPSKPAQSKKKTPQTPDKSTPTTPAKKQQSSVQQKQTKKKSLPQTGSEQATTVSALGLLGLSAGLGLGFKKRKHS